MRHCKLLLYLVLVVLSASVLMAQGTPNIEVTKLTDHIYELTSTIPYRVNFLASVGDDGILLVDCGQKNTAEELINVLKSISDKPVKYIIYTHAHTEHTGGNIVFGSDVIRIGHLGMRTRMVSGGHIFDEYTDTALPTICFTDSMSLFFNGEQIRMIALTGAHDSEDIIVHFTKSKIVATGALSAGMHFPTVDYAGGNATKYPETVQKLIDLLPPDVTLVPGHGRTTNMDEEKQFQNMLAKTIEIVKTGIASGKDAAALQTENVLKDWTSFNGEFAGTNEWIQMVANSINKGPIKKPVSAEMYTVYKNSGIDSAIGKWNDLKKNHPDEYNFRENQLVTFGYYVLGKGKAKEAIKVFELYVKEFPTSWNAYDCLGEAYMTDGQNKLAKKNYKQSLKLNPQNTNANDMLKKL